jgi:hypothetical protein
MDFKFLIHTVRNIILDPVKEWDVIHTENKPASYFSINIILPLLLLVSVSEFLGSFLFTNTELANTYSVLTGVRYFIMLSIVILGSAFVFKEITNALGLGKDFYLSFKIIACSVVPFFLCQILSRLFESFMFVNILSFYGLYILWAGIEKMIDPPERGKIILLILTPGAFIALLSFTSWILAMLFDKLYFSIFA